MQDPTQNHARAIAKPLCEPQFDLIKALRAILERESITFLNVRACDFCKAK
jgi:hypothetical protein